MTQRSREMVMSQSAKLMTGRQLPNRRDFLICVCTSDAKLIVPKYSLPLRSASIFLRHFDN